MALITQSLLILLLGANSEGKPKSLDTTCGTRLEKIGQVIRERYDRKGNLILLNSEYVQVISPTGEEKLFVRAGGRWPSVSADSLLKPYLTNFMKLTESKSEVLEIGTGGGETVEELRKKGVVAHGVDLILPPENLSKAYFREGSADETGYESDRFKIVFEHFGPIHYAEVLANGTSPEMANYLIEIKRISKSGGKLIVPSAKDSSDTQNRFENKRKALIKEASRLGFKIISSEPGIGTVLEK